jgi:hypothetical protein
MSRVRPFALVLCALFGVSCAQGGADLAAPEPPDVDRGGAPTPPGMRAAMWKGIPGEHVEWLKYPAQNAKTGGSWGVALTDIAQHLPSSYGDMYWDSDLITAGHETSHGIHSELRNNHNTTGKKANGFYVLNDRAVIVVEPNIRKSDVAPYIPTSLRGSRYSLYITGQVEWDDTPLYIWDEWNAYANGGDVGVDLVNRGLWTYGWRDGVAGELEFVVYATAVAMAVQKKDPTYFDGYDQFREFLAWNVRRSMNSYRAGAKMEAFKWADQDAYYERMKNDAGAATWRDFVRGYFGADWANAVLFGADPGPVDAGPADTGPSVVDSGPGVVDSGGGSAADSGVSDTGTIDPIDSGSGDSGGGGAADDEDGDGVKDILDLCSKSPPGAPVWTSGDWIGCAAGQHRDGGGGADSDGDGIPDTKDRCSKTAAGARVWQWGDWIGCAAGQHRD